MVFQHNRVQVPDNHRPIDDPDRKPTWSPIRRLSG